MSISNGALMFYTMQCYFQVDLLFAVQGSLDVASKMPSEEAMFNYVC